MGNHGSWQGGCSAPWDAGRHTRQRRRTPWHTSDILATPLPLPTTVLHILASPRLCPRSVEEQQEAALLTFAAAPTAMDPKEWARHKNGLEVTAKAGKGCAAVVRAACELPLCPSDAFEVRCIAREDGWANAATPQRALGICNPPPPRPARGLARAARADCIQPPAAALLAISRPQQPSAILLQLFAHPDNAVIFRGIERCTYRRILWAAADSLSGDGRQTIEVENESGAQCCCWNMLLHCFPLTSQPQGCSSAVGESGRRTPPARLCGTATSQTGGVLSCTAASLACWSAACLPGTGLLYQNVCSTSGSTECTLYMRFPHGAVAGAS